MATGLKTTESQADALASRLQGWSGFHGPFSSPSRSGLQAPQSSPCQFPDQRPEQVAPASPSNLQVLAAIGKSQTCMQQQIVCHCSTVLPCSTLRRAALAATHDSALQGAE